MSQVIIAEVKNMDGSSFRQVIKPDPRYFNGDIHKLCRDMFQDALVSVNKPFVKAEKNVKKDLGAID